MRVSLTRRVGFRASHFLRLPDLSEEDNRARFGETVTPHAHDYVCDVTISGSMVHGMLVDLTQLDHVLKAHIAKQLGGTSLNQSLPACARQEALPTCEVLASWCWNELVNALPLGVELEKVRVAEDETLYAECTGTL